MEDKLLRLLIMGKLVQGLIERNPVIVAFNKKYPNNPDKVINLILNQNYN